MWVQMPFFFLFDYYYCFVISRTQSNNTIGVISTLREKAGKTQNKRALRKDFPKQQQYFFLFILYYNCLIASCIYRPLNTPSKMSFMKKCLDIDSIQISKKNKSV